MDPLPGSCLCAVSPWGVSGIFGLVLLSAALVSHQLGRGHICLDLGRALADPDATLVLPPEGETGEDLPLRPAQVLAGLDLSQWEKALQSDVLVAVKEEKRPLVLNDHRLYLYRFWDHTCFVAGAVIHRVARQLGVPRDLKQRLDLAFAPLRSPEEVSRQEIHWQSIAAAAAARSAFTVISGGPGTGKTTTVVRLLALLQAPALEAGTPLKIRLAAPTGKAAARLTESMGPALDQVSTDIAQTLPREVTTLHRLLGSRPGSRGFVHHDTHPLHVDLLVVDEASMVDLEMMAALFHALPSHARLILLGDKDQLASVEAGAVLGDLCRHAEPPFYGADFVAWAGQVTGYDLTPFQGPAHPLQSHIVVLQKSHRFGEKSGIGALARAVNQGDGKRSRALLKGDMADIRSLTVSDCGERAFQRLVLDGGVDEDRGRSKTAGAARARAGSTGKGNLGDGAPAAHGNVVAGYRTCLEAVAHSPWQGTGKVFPEEGDLHRESQWLKRVLDLFGRFQVLAAVRKGPFGVEALNATIARMLHRTGLIPAEAGWYPGRPVMVTRNDYSLGLMNGDVGIYLPVWDAHRAAIVCRGVFPLADGTLKKVLPSRLTHVETVYAMTVHKAQGSEFDHTVLVLPDVMSPVLTRELLYTGITRARSCFTLVTPPGRLLEQAIERRTLRSSGLGDLLEAELLTASETEFRSARGDYKKE